MQTQHYSIVINAPKEKVWHAMLDEATYKEWTLPFNAGGSFFKGNWEKGSKMLFIGPDPETGEEGGMVSYVEENRPYEYISLKHVGVMVKGVEDTTSELAKQWTPAFENYTLKETDGKTEVLVDLDLAEENVDIFNGMWPKALEKLKEIAEK